MKLDIFKLRLWVISLLWADLRGFINCHRLPGQEQCYDGCTCRTWFGYSACTAIYWYPTLCRCCHGYRMENYQCVDINECQMNVCDQLCVNTAGSYKCLCYRGYLRKQGRCVSAGPCFRPSQMCKQICKPLGKHKYRCECYPGFVLAPDIVSCKAISAA